MRIRYGVPIFVTFSPDEAHNLLMIRLSRTRRNDTVFAEGSDPVGKKYCGRRDPPLGEPHDAFVHNSKPCANNVDTGIKEDDDVIMGVPVEDIISALPTYDEHPLMASRCSSWLHTNICSVCEYACFVQTAMQ